MAYYFDFWTAVDKIEKVIVSCETIEQLDNAVQWMDDYKRRCSGKFDVYGEHIYLEGLKRLAEEKERSIRKINELNGIIKQLKKQITKTNSSWKRRY